MTFNSVVEKLNLLGEHFGRVAWPLFWQSTILIAVILFVDILLRRKLRPSVRHALWLIVLVKLLLPPSLALPTGIGWWLRQREAAAAEQPVRSYIVTYGPAHATMPLPKSTYATIETPRIRLSASGWALAGASGTSLALLIIMLVRWRRLRHQIYQSQPAPSWLEESVWRAQREAGCRKRVRLMLTDASISPALYGLFRPVIVLPIALVERLKPSQLRAVLLHELFHLRNGDVWINCIQSLLQIVFWWHPLLWLANARVRGLREEVVDDSVRLALAEDSETYAPTLLEVARLALARPLATLGFVGILESRHALRSRVERLINFPAPRRVGLSFVSVLGVLAFTSVALPMGQAPPKSVKSIRLSNSNTGITEKEKGAESGKVAWDIQPINENGWVEYDIASGIGTATNGAVVTHGDTVISADNITVNQQTGEVVASGSVKIQSGVNENNWIKYDLATGTATATNGAVLRQGDRVVRADNVTFDRETGKVVVGGHYNSKSASRDMTNLQLAQYQPSVSGSSRLIHTSSGRKAIMNKLEAIRLNNVIFDNLPLSEVVNYLRDEAKKRDPEGKGINFLINPNSDTPAPALDPATGLPVAPQTEAVDINGVAIRILPSLNDVRMIDVLDAIIKVADKRIRYSIEDYGVSFRLAGNEPVPLFTRAIKVDPNTFAQGLESVVGFSVGSFQTGGQGGGGQQGNSSGVTVPRVQVAPNTGGQAAQGGQGGAQGGGGISGVTRPTTMISPQAVRQFFVNAGVDLTPPKSVFFNDRAGTLLVHATADDLDIIERAMGALSTSPAQPAKTRIVVQADRAGPATVRLYTNEQFLGEQRVDLSAGKNLFTFPTYPVPAPTNQAKLPVLGDLPVVGSQFQVRTVQLAAANSPQHMTNAANGDSGAKLLTHTMKVNPDTFREGIRTIVPLPDNASPQETMDAFHKLVLSSGVQLAPPANMFYSERTGSLFVRAIAPEMEAIEQMVQQLNYLPPQVNIQARFVEVSDDDTNLIALNSDTNGPVLAVLTDPQFRVVLHALEQRDGVDIVSEQNVTTVSGRQAQMQNADIHTIVKLNPQALVPPGVVSSNVYVTERLFSGPLLDIIPFVSESGDQVQLTVTAKVTEFVGYDPPDSSEAVTVYLEGQASTIKPPHPRTHVRTMQAAVSLYDGQTVVLGRPKDEMITFDKEGKALSAPSATKKNLFVFVTATLIDAQGNPAHSTGSPASQSH